MFYEQPTPTLFLDIDRLDANIAAMQDACDAAGVGLRPHIKTHKMTQVARRQLRAGAAGLCCAKLGEAEAMLPAFEDAPGKREMFIAHSLVDPQLAPRLQALHAQLDELALACTSPAHAPALETLAARAGIRFPTVMALDSGLGREGARDIPSAVHLAQIIERSPHLELRGFYTHEGHFYGANFAESEAKLHAWHQRLLEIRGAVEDALGGPKLGLWPGCSVSARRVSSLPGISAVRPGSYVFGDLGLCDTTGVISPDACALTVLATVVDRPCDDLALLDCGSKTLSSDRTPAGIYASCEAGDVLRVNEEHGYLRGAGANELSVGQRLRLVPAHVCPVVNLADCVAVVRGEEILDFWRVEARGKVQ